MELIADALVQLTSESLDARREAIALQTSQKHKLELGQFMTPSVIATFMASMFSPLKGKNLLLLDAGAGIGSLTAAFAHRAYVEKAASLSCEAWEIDENLRKPLESTLNACRKVVADAGGKFSSCIHGDDFILSFSKSVNQKNSRSKPTHAILNPPYKKISSQSNHRLALRECGVETANLYSAFVALALVKLADGGELVAITPRSFCNGPYFKPFREMILTKSAIKRIHVFESRTHAFKSDSVLQENVIFHLVKGAKQGAVVVSSSEDATFSSVRIKTNSFTEIILPDDPEKIIHIRLEKEGVEASKAMALYQYSLEDIGLGVSTGPVVDFRNREHLRNQDSGNCAAMIHPHHFQNGFVVHPKLESKKPNFIEINEYTRKWLLPNGCYVAIRRLSSKEEKRRIVPAVFLPNVSAGDFVGFDNKTNIFHQNKDGMDESLAKGIALYLGSTFVDQWLRRFSGHTQVNAGDLRALRYPSIKTLQAWGKKIGVTLPSQEKIDQLVGGVDVKNR